MILSPATTTIPFTSPKPAQTPRCGNLWKSTGLTEEECKKVYVIGWWACNQFSRQDELLKWSREELERIDFFGVYYQMHRREGSGFKRKDADWEMMYKALIAFLKKPRPPEPREPRYIYPRGKINYQGANCRSKVRSQTGAMDCNPKRGISEGQWEGNSYVL